MLCSVMLPNGQSQYPHSNVEYLASVAHHGMPPESTIVHLLYSVPLYSKGKKQALFLLGPDITFPLPIK